MRGGKTRAGAVRGFSARLAWGTSAAVAALGLGTAQAQETGERLYADAGGDITVVATRHETDVFDAPAVVSVIDDEEIEENLVSDIKDLIRFEPGVSVRSAPSRFGAALAATGRDGNAGFNIRGLEDNRVLMQVDGVRVPDGFAFGPAAFGRGDYVDLDLLRSVEIMRGPGSALYGSDGLAGVVSFTTKDPADFLRDDETFAVRVRAAYASADDSWAEGVAAAGRWGDWSALVAYTRRDGHELDNQGDDDARNSTRTEPNPQDISSNAALARLVFQPNAQHRFRLTADYSDRDIVTEAYSGRAVPPYGASSVIDLDGVDESERRRIAFDHTYQGEGLLESVFWTVYYQDSDVSQFSDEDRFTSADRTRLTTFANEVWGAAAQAESVFATGSVGHRLTYGFDYSLTRQEGVRDGTVPPVGESFPTRAFPNTEYALTGVFVQDEISLLNGELMLYPALRYDSYELDPEADALYPLAVEGQSDDHISPRFGAVAWPTQHFGVFFNAATGFKAPSPSQVNNNFANPLFGYTSIPNPDLEPETSQSFEAGVRFRDVTLLGGDWRASASAFSGWYEDFIEQVQVGGSFTPVDPAQFQYVNLGEVEIWGVEGRADGRWDNGFGVTVAASFAEGEQTSGGVRAPLLSVDPWKLVAGLSYDESGGRYGGQFIVTYVGGKDEDDACAGCFTPPDFTLLDVTAYWRLSEAATLRAGVFNLTDETYWWWSDVRGLSSASTVRDAYSQPGTNVSASISYRF